MSDIDPLPEDLANDIRNYREVADIVIICAQHRFFHTIEQCIEMEFPGIQGLLVL